MPVLPRETQAGSFVEGGEGRPGWLLTGWGAPAIQADRLFYLRDRGGRSQQTQLDLLTALQRCWNCPVESEDIFKLSGSLLKGKKSRLRISHFPASPMTLGTFSLHC